jgi:hypothetical protein
MNLQNTVLRTNFANGVVSPGIWDRTDWNKHASSVRSAVNFFVSPTGGLRKRHGTRFLDYALDVDMQGEHHPPHLIKFEFSVGQTYILEFGDKIMRFWIDDHLILDPSTGSPYQISTPYSYDQITKVSHAQYKDTMFCTHWDLPIKKLVRGPSSSHTNWWWEDVIVDETVLVRAPENLKFDVEGHNGVGYMVTGVINGQESKGAYEIVTTRIHNPEIEQIFKDGVSLPAQSSDPVQQYLNNRAWFVKYTTSLGGLPNFPKFTPNADLDALVVVTNDLDAITLETSLLTKLFGINSYPRSLSFRVNKYHYVGSSPRYPLGFQYFFDFWGSSSIYTFPLFYLLYSSTSGFPLMSWGYGSSPEATQDWGTILAYGSSSTLGLPSGFPNFVNTESFFNRDTLISIVVREYLLSCFRSGRFGSLGSSEVYNQIVSFITWQTPKVNNKISWTNKNGNYTDKDGNVKPYPKAETFKVYRRVLDDSNQPHLYFVASLPGTTFTWEDADVAGTIVDTALSPPETGQFFDGENKYPMACTLFQQRLVVGSTKESPLMVGASVPGQYNDFSKSQNPNDVFAAWVFELSSQTSNPVKHLIPIRTLYILSEAGSFISTVSGSVNAGNVNFNQEAYAGSSDIKPVIVDKSVIYVPLNKQMISSLAYEFANDAFADDNMIFAAQHLLTGTAVRSLDYCRPISSLIFATTEDGRFLACTFIPRQEFLAWTEHITQGQFCQVCTCTNKSGFDEPYFTVFRNGKYLIEKLEDTRPFQDKTLMSELFLDSALTGEFAEDTSVVSGLDHLEGLTVGVIVNGSVQQNKIVENGQIVLDSPGRLVHVGLPFTASMETLDFEMQGIPTLRGSVRHIVKAVVGVEETSDITWQLNNGDKWDAPLTNAEDLASPPKVKTFDIAIGGTSDYVNGTRLKLESRYPLPCSINSIVVEVQYA